MRSNPIQSNPILVFFHYVPVDKLRYMLLKVLHVPYGLHGNPGTSTRRHLLHVRFTILGIMYLVLFYSGILPSNRSLERELFITYN